MRVMVFGTFDLLHPGHCFLLEEAGRRGDVTVIVARDQNVEKIKKLQPTQSEEDRRHALCQAFPQYDIRLGNREDFLAPVREMRPDLILLGYDQKLPPGVSEAELQKLTRSIGRLRAHKPEEFKSSKRRALKKCHGEPVEP